MSDLSDEMRSRARHKWLCRATPIHALGGGFAVVTEIVSTDTLPLERWLTMCLSAGLVDQTRPLRFTSTTPQALDTVNCAVTLN